MPINKCELQAIKSRVNAGVATNKDCFDLLEYMQIELTPEKYSDKIECAVSRYLGRRYRQGCRAGG